MTVADELGEGLVLAGQRGAHHAGLAMVQAAHTVVGVDKDLGTGIEASLGLFASCRGVTEGDHDAGGDGICGELGGALILGSDGDLLYQAVSGLLPGIQLLHSGSGQVSGVLGALVLLGKEGTLEEDALDTGVRSLIPGLDILGDAGACALKLLGARGERGGQIAGDAVAQDAARNGGDALGLAIHDVVVIEAVDMRIDESGGDLVPGVVQNLAVRSLGHVLAKNAVLNHEVATAGYAGGKIEGVCLDCIGAHSCLLTHVR